MKITIKPSSERLADNPFWVDGTSIEIPDESTIDEVMIAYAKLLFAFGYHQDSISATLNKELANEVFGVPMSDVFGSKD